MFTISNEFLLPVVVLGAADPEMNAIEVALRYLNVSFYYAGANGVRVHPGNAYAATFAIHPEVDGLHGIRVDALFVECEIAGFARINVADHHRPGDYGFGRNPADFWDASSIGQVYNFLKEWGDAHPSLGWSTMVLNDAFGGDRFNIAASDHCPAHAFAGMCPGIDVDYLRRMRARNSASFNKMEPDQWLQAVEAACRILEGLPRVATPAGDYAVAVEEVPFLNHAQLFTNIPVEYRMNGTPRDPRNKVGLLGGTNSELVRYWMDAKASELDGIYGDPSRGYAGGYVKA